MVQRNRSGGSGPSKYSPDWFKQKGENALSAARSGGPLTYLSIALLIGFLALVWVLRPWFQPIYYTFRFKLVGMLMYGALGTGVYVLAKYVYRKGYGKASFALKGVAVLLLLIALASPMIAGIYTDEALADRVNSGTPATGNLSEAPAVDNSNIRVMTMKGAETQAQTSFNQPTHQLTDGELVKRDGDLSTSYAATPESLYKSLTMKQQGAVFVNINSKDPTVNRVNDKFKCGRGMLIFDDVKFQIQKNNMNTVLTNPTTFQGNDGELYNMYTGVQHDLRFGIDNGVPMIYPVPEYSSVHLSDTDCNKEKLTPEEAVTDSRMDGENKQQFYPYGLMRQEVIATNLQNGWINTFTSKTGMKEYPDTPSIDNRPPYTMVFEDGSYGQVLTMEAVGDGSGVFEVYIGNGRTGDKTKFEFESPQKGPGYAVDATITNDAEKYGEGKLTVSEVYPVFRNGELWWQVNSVQSDTGVYAYTAFYNPGEGDLLKAFEDEQMKHFYAGSGETYTQPDKTIEAPGEDDGTRTVEDPTLWVVVEDENGDTYTVPVAGNESVNVTQEEPEDDNDNSSSSN